MDGRRFDELTRSLVTSRRGALLAILAGIGSGLTRAGSVRAQTEDDDPEDRRADAEAERAARAAEREAERAAREAEREAEQAAREAERAAEQAAREAERAAAAAEREAERAAAAAARSAFHRAGRRCHSQQPCGSMAPCTDGICTPIACQIGNDIVAAGVINPANECQSCAPTAASWMGWTGQVADGAACTQASDDPCLSIDGQCRAGQCANNALPDGSPCGNGQECCGGSCCASDECCTEAGTCGTCGPHCVIDGAVVQPGPHPTHDCLACVPEISTSNWTAGAEGNVCGSSAGRVCCNGDCCAPDECCDGLQCVDCGPHCRIDGTVHQPDRPNPTNVCQYCDPESSRVDWTPIANGSICGEFGTKQCCGGDCCGVNNDGNNCCNNGVCDLCRCSIGNDTFTEGRINPDNSCQLCRSFQNPNDWTTLADGVSCSVEEGRVCCAGECCPVGHCCTNGACAPCPCIIGTGSYAAGSHNTLNHCLSCQPEISRNSWTPITDGSECGLNGENRVCCNAECCEPGHCCTDGACSLCPCQIGIASVSAGTVNLDNPCLICDPTRSRNDWSPLGEDVSCGLDGTGVCCNGECCSDELCCTLDSCGTCLCHIDGRNYADGASEPLNVCLYCDAHVEEFDWTARPNNYSCGVDRVCCGSTCCEENECCVLDVCSEVCGCLIDGEEWSDQARNPANVCEICDPVVDKDNWSSLTTDDSPCGNVIDQVCCNGECCPEGWCCSLERSCEPCTCRIGETEYVSGAFNPENDCEYCHASVNPIGWTVVAADVPCGDEEGRVCCHGTCCPVGQCCVGNACAQCPCLIGNEPYLAGDRHPDNDCLACRPEISRDAWTPVDDEEICGTQVGQVCCSGVCCESEECCLAGACRGCGCFIDETEVIPDATKPGEPCQYCDPGVSETEWTPRDNHIRCNEPLEGVRICCGGECCGTGDCCLSDEMCGECECQIGEDTYQRLDENPDNDCQYCDPNRNHLGWTTFSDGVPCGENSDHFCCSGVCRPCPCDQEECMCTIDGESIPDGSTDPGNACQVCSVLESATSWTALGDGVTCGTGAGMSCCAGTCTECDCVQDEGLVSAASRIVCQSPCLIDGVEYEHGALNPQNECEACDSEVSRESWSEAPFLTKCGPGDSRVCCQGVCCESGDCCHPSFTSCSVEWCGIVDPCPYIDGACGCTIAGVFYAHNTAHPDNECQLCDAYWSTTDWSHRRFGNTRCGVHNDRFCCEGVCCEAGSCCTREGGACQESLPGWCTGCVIGGRFFFNNAINPDDKCQQCDMSQSTGSWSNASNGRTCEAVIIEGVYWGDRVCCEGICCETYAECCSFANICEALPTPMCQ